MADDPLPEQELIPVDPLVNCIVFDASGRIRQSGVCALSLLDAHAAHFGEGFAAIEVPEGQFDRNIDRNAYVLDGVITPKASIIERTEFTVAADGVETVSFAVPAGTSVWHDGEQFNIEDGTFEFSADDIGVFAFAFVAPAAFKDFEVTIHAV